MVNLPGITTPSNAPGSISVASTNPIQTPASNLEQIPTVQDANQPQNQSTTPQRTTTQFTLPPGVNLPPGSKQILLPSVGLSSYNPSTYKGAYNPSQYYVLPSGQIVHVNGLAEFVQGKGIVPRYAVEPLQSKVANERFQDYVRGGETRGEYHFYEAPTGGNPSVTSNPANIINETERQQSIAATNKYLQGQTLNPDESRLVSPATLPAPGSGAVATQTGIFTPTALTVKSVAGAGPDTGLYGKITVAPQTQAELLNQARLTDIAALTNALGHQPNAEELAYAEANPQSTLSLVQREIAGIQAIPNASPQDIQRFKGAVLGPATQAPEWFQLTGSNGPVVYQSEASAAYAGPKLGPAFTGDLQTDLLISKTPLPTSSSTSILPSTGTSSTQSQPPQPSGGFEFYTPPGGRFTLLLGEGAPAAKQFAEALDTTMQKFTQGIENQIQAGALTEQNAREISLRQNLGLPISLSSNPTQFAAPTDTTIAEIGKGAAGVLFSFPLALTKFGVGATESIVYGGYLGSIEARKAAGDTTITPRELEVAEQVKTKELPSALVETFILPGTIYGTGAVLGYGGQLLGTTGQTVLQSIPILNSPTASQTIEDVLGPTATQAAKNVFSSTTAQQVGEVLLKGGLVGVGALSQAFEPVTSKNVEITQTETGPKITQTTETTYRFNPYSALGGGLGALASIKIGEELPSLLGKIPQKLTGVNPGIEQEFMNPDEAKALAAANPSIKVDEGQAAKGLVAEYKSQIAANKFEMSNIGAGAPSPDRVAQIEAENAYLQSQISELSHRLPSPAQSSRDAFQRFLAEAYTPPQGETFFSSGVPSIEPRVSASDLGQPILSVESSPLPESTGGIQSQGLSQAQSLVNIPRQVIIPPAIAFQPTTTTGISRIESDLNSLSQSQSQFPIARTPTAQQQQTAIDVNQVNLQRSIEQAPQNIQPRLDIFQSPESRAILAPTQEVIQQPPTQLIELPTQPPLLQTPTQEQITTPITTPIEETKTGNKQTTLTPVQQVQLEQYLLGRSLLGQSSTLGQLQTQASLQAQAQQQASLSLQGQSQSQLQTQAQLQSQSQAQLQSQVQAQIQSQVQAQAQAQLQAQVQDQIFGIPTSMIGMNKKKRLVARKSPLRIPNIAPPKVGILPDLLSQDIASIRYGTENVRAVNPITNPGIFKVAQNAFGYVPTADVYFRKQPKPSNPTQLKMRLPKLKGLFGSRRKKK